MSVDELDRQAMKSRWMRELERLATYKTQLHLSGNVKDQFFYPLDRDLRQWTVGSLRDALFECFRTQLGNYDIIAAYNPIEGMCFADCYDANTMVKSFDEVLQQVQKATPPPPGGRIPQPVRSEDPIIHAFEQMGLCLRNTTRSCVFILENASQYITAPANLQRDERFLVLRLLKSASACSLVSRGQGAARSSVQNLLVLLCDNQRDLPPWLYLNNPFCGNIEIETPRSDERTHFFEWRLQARQAANAPAAPVVIDMKELVDRTDDMATRDLWGICALADHAADYGITKTKELVDTYKYGARRSEWDLLDWQRLQSAEEVLTRRVLGQPAAVTAVADVLRRARLDLSGAQHSSHSKPRGVLFFAGPTGVGKTELAKAIAELIFSTEEACIRFDMSEFSQSHSDQRLLGAPPGYVGYEEGGQLTNKVKANPFSVLLFDEIEKAHPSILDKFLQILEDGRMTDGHGETVYFSESIIIFTSNVGVYQLDPLTGRPKINPVDGKPLLQVDPAVDTEYGAVRAKLLEGVASYFKYVLGRPELLNRIGQNIIVFDFVRQATLRLILEKKVLKSIARQIQERWKVNVEFDPAVIETLMALGGNDVAAGGRGIGNLAETAVLNPLARALFAMMEGGVEAEAAMAGKTLVVNEVIAPHQANDQRYEIRYDIR